MSPEEMSDLWERQYRREKSARKEAEELLEKKSRELYQSNEKLKLLAQELEQRVVARTQMLEAQRNAVLEKSEKLVYSQKRFQDVIEAAGEYIWETDAQLCVTYLSNPATPAFGYAIDELLGLPLAALFNPEEQESVTFFIDISQRKKAFKGRIIKSRHKDGHMIWQSVSGTPIFDGEGSFAGYRGTGLDITDIQIAKEDAIKAHQAKSTFLSNMSHEIRTPLNGIVGLSQFLIESNMDTRQLGYARAIKSSADALFFLTNKLFDISAIQEGKLILHQEDYCINDLLDDVLDFATLEAKRKGLHVTLSIGSDLPQWAWGDETRLRQALTNLFDNAVKYSETGTISLNVSLLSQGTAAPLILFEVADQGRGIEEEDIERIFSSPEGAHLRSYEKDGGAGLGLAIARGIAQSMGGTLQARSEVAVGSVFTLSVPLIQSKRSPTLLTETYCLIVGERGPLTSTLLNIVHRFGAHTEHLDYAAYRKSNLRLSKPTNASASFILKVNPSDSQPSAEVDQQWIAEGYEIHRIFDERSRLGRSSPSALNTPIRHHQVLRLLKNLDTDRDGLGLQSAPDAFQGKRCLVVDDNITNLLVAKTMLEQFSFVADLAQSGQEGIEKIKSQSYDAILMDLRMPGMSGIETTREIRRLGNDTPIIAVTANTVEESELQELKAAGIYSIIYKPLFKWKLRNHLLKHFAPDQHSSFEDKRILDEEELATLFSRNTQTVKVVARGYVEQATLLLAKLDASIANGDRQDQLDYLHNLSGASYTIRAEALGDACSALQASIRNEENEPRREQLLAKVHEAYAILDKRLQALINSSHP